MALEEIKRVTEKAEKSTLTGAELVLYDDGRGMVEPAYHFTVNRLIDLGESDPAAIPYDFYVPIAKEPRAFYPYMDTALVQPDDNTTKAYRGDSE
jgi:hypothetical protein